MSQFAKKVDINQPEIVQSLRQAGYEVVLTHRQGGGFPDLVVASHSGLNILMEIKRPREDLNELEQEFHDCWPGHICVVHTPEEALKVLRWYDNLGLHNNALKPGDDGLRE